MKNEKLKAKNNGRKQRRKTTAENNGRKQQHPPVVLEDLGNTAEGLTGKEW
jgi:hypothetical protein